MAIDVAVSDNDVQRVREALDPLTTIPPTVGKNELAPRSTILNYTGIKGPEVEFMMTAMRLGGVSCSRV